jgi:hypothetical protein
VRQTGARACMRATRARAGTDVQLVFGEKPQRIGRDANAMSRRQRVVTAHGKAVAGPWRGKAGLRPEVGVGSAVSVCAEVCVRAAR